MGQHFEIRHSVHGLQDYTIDYQCGHCERHVAGVVVARYDNKYTQWLACPSCKRGSVSHGGNITPLSLLGEDVRGLPEPIKGVYEEARKSFSSKSYTACELVCRKILMNVAVNKGSAQRKPFDTYIDDLTKKGHITSAMKPWIKQIKDNGNESTHKIATPDSNRTERTLQFTALLLRNVYETEELMKGSSEDTDPDQGSQGPKGA